MASNLGLTLLVASQSDKTTTVNEALVHLDNALTETLTKAMADSNQTLSAEEAGEYLRYLLTGALTAGRDLVVPAANKKLYLLQDQTTGGFAVTAKVTGQPGIVVPKSPRYVLAYCDGTDVVRIQDFDPSPFGRSTTTASLDFQGNDVRTLAIATNTNLTISNPVQSRTVLLEVTSSSGAILTLPGSVTIIGGGTFVANVVNYITLFCNDQATPSYLATIAQ